MAPAYKVTYFDITGLAEPIRLILSYGGIEFEDNRFKHENWPAIKPNTPFGKVPTLEHNGKIAHQSMAICRYLAKQVKLVGRDDWEDLEIDAVVDTITDFRSKFAQYRFEQDEKAKAIKAEYVFKEMFPFYVEKFDTQVKNNNGYFVNGRLTWADIVFVSLMDYICQMENKDIIADAPNLQIVKENVLKIPGIKAWIEKRPKS